MRAKEGRPGVARFLRAMSASEAVQAHRLFNSLIGRIDTSDQNLLTMLLLKDRPSCMHY
jgi:hypothetical protein